MTAIVCRHCRTCRPHRCRGLCFSCYHRPGVRESYPTESKYGRRGVATGDVKERHPTSPTPAAPGSEEKIAVMTRRAERMESLFHQADGRCGYGS